VDELKTQLRANDVLANERTFLAYVRTALAFIAFGFVIARFSLFTKEFAQLMHLDTNASGVSVAFGTGMAAFGILISLVGAWRYAATHRGLTQGRVIAMSSLASYVISIAIAIIGAVVAFELLSYK